MAANFPLDKGWTVFLPLACPCLSMHSLQVSQAVKNNSLIFSYAAATMQLAPGL